VRSHSHSVVVIAIMQCKQLLSPEQGGGAHLNLNLVTIGDIKRCAFVGIVHKKVHSSRSRNVRSYRCGDENSVTEV
jgi:hypothetical protein